MPSRTDDPRTHAEYGQAEGDGIGSGRIFLLLGAVLGLSGVVLGAVETHAVGRAAPSADLGVFDTGVRYQVYHALALIGAAWAADRWPQASFRVAGWAFAAGTLLFSGSLYVLALGGPGWIGPFTPLGGVVLILGWGALGWGAARGAIETP